MPPKRQYDVTPLDVIRALARLVNGVRQDIQSDINAHPEVWEREQADERQRYAEAIEDEKKDRARWEAFESQLAESQRAASRPYKYYGYVPPKPKQETYPGTPPALLRELARPCCYYWFAYDLHEFAGTSYLTESQKQRWRKTIREMEADKLVERDVRRIRMTKKGEAMLTAEAKQ